MPGKSEFEQIINALRARLDALESASGGSVDLVAVLSRLQDIEATVASNQTSIADLVTGLQSLDAEVTDHLMDVSKSFSILSGPVGGTDLVIPPPSDPPIEPDFFVDASVADETGDGSSGDPWKTLAQVSASAFSPGERISFRRGVEPYRGKLVVSSSGTSGNPIVFTAHGSGDDPPLDGSVDVIGVTGNWTNAGSNRWTRSFTPTDSGSQDLLYINFGIGGESIQNKQSTQANVNAAGEWFLAASTLTVYSTSNPASAFTTIEINDRSRVLDVTGRSWLTFENLRFTKGRYGTRIINATNIALTECLSNYNGVGGKRVEGTSSTITFTNCDSVDNGVFDPLSPGGKSQHGLLVRGTATGVTVDGGNFSRNAEDGFQSTSTGGGTVLTIRNTTAVNNYENPADFKNGNLIVLEDNHWVGDPTTGNIALRIQNGTIDVVSNRNYYESGGADAFQRALGISDDGKITSTGDTFVGSDLGGDVGSRAVWLESTVSRASSFEASLMLSFGSRSTVRFQAATDHSLKQCTIRATGSGQGLDLDNAATATAENTIIHTVSANCANVASTATLTGNGNLYERNGTTGFIVDGGTTYDEGDITSFDANGTSGDPVYKNEGAADYSPTNGGAADGAGATGVGVTNDMEGVPYPDPPDIGALVAEAA